MDGLRSGGGKGVSGGLVFISGGSAWRETSRRLAETGLFSTHLLPAFDSGGSTGRLRSILSMPAMGDARNRMTALVPKDASPDARRLARLMEMRLERYYSRHEVETFVRDELGPDALPPGCISCPADDLGRLLRHLPYDFDLSGASIGNMMIAGALLSRESSERKCLEGLPPPGINQVLEDYCRLLETVGLVALTCEGDFHLQFGPLPGRGMVIGQHMIGKAASEAVTQEASFRPGPELLKAIPAYHHRPSPPAEMDEDGQDAGSNRPGANSIHRFPMGSPRAIKAITEAEIICLCVGSFLTSIAANLLPVGIGSALLAARNRGGKVVFIPNPQEDPEASGLDLVAQVQFLESLVEMDLHRQDDRKNSNDTAGIFRFTHVLLDLGKGHYGNLNEKEIEATIQTLDCGDRRVVTDRFLQGEPPKVSPTRIIQLLTRL